MSFRRFAVLLITLVAVAMGGTVNAQNKVVVYSANGGNLNRFVFDGFTKETGIAVEGVTAGSACCFAASLPSARSRLAILCGV